MLKSKFFFLLFSIIFVSGIGCESDVKSDSFWGVWNPEGHQTNFVTKRTPTGMYKGMFTSVEFRQGDGNEEPMIGVPSDQLFINKISGTFPLFHFDVKKQYSKGVDKNGESIKAWREGTIDMHFISKNQVWFEIQGNELAESIRRLGSWIEFGPDKKYLRAEKIEKPLPTESAGP